MSTVKTKAGTELPLKNLQGKQYLEVAYRVLWMREEHMDWGITTEYLQLSSEMAIAKATITNGNGKVIAQGTKSETPKGFADYIEKAETGAVGRALALCGYGTQFAQELEEGERIVDGPREPKGKPNLQAVSNPDDLGAYVMPFGKYKGKTLEQMGPHGVDGWKNSILDMLREKNEPPSIKMVEALDAADAFLKSREVPRAK